MAVKILLGPSRKGDSFIVGEDGELKIVDVPRRCWGRHSCCCCKACTERAAQARKGAQRAKQVCVCDAPMLEGKHCLRCGKPSIKAA